VESGTRGWVTVARGGLKCVGGDEKSVVVIGSDKMDGKR
jgi:hypothetical protein